MLRRITAAVLMAALSCAEAHAEHFVHGEFTTDVLRISYLCADSVVIHVVDGAKAVSFEASAPTEDALNIKTDSGFLGTPDLDCSFKPSNLRGRGGYKVFTAGHAASSTRLEIAVPAGMPLEIRSDGTDYTVRGPVGDVRFKVIGIAEVKIDEAKAASIDVTGAGEVNLGTVHGNATVNTSSAGDVMISSGDIPMLKANVVGGALRVGAHVEEAELNIFSGSKIALSNRPRSIEGSGIGQGTAAGLTFDGI